MYSKMRFYGVGVSCTDASAVVLNVENLLVPVQSRLATGTISNLPGKLLQKGTTVKMYKKK